MGTAPEPYFGEVCHGDELNFVLNLNDFYRCSITRFSLSPQEV